MTETVAPPAALAVAGGASAGEQSLREHAAATLQRATDHLRGLQNPAGWWQGELETNVTMDAEDLLLREFLGLHDDETIASATSVCRAQQPQS